MPQLSTSRSLLYLVVTTFWLGLRRSQYFRVRTRFKGIISCNGPKKSASICNNKIYEYVLVPFGLVSAPSNFQLAVNTILSGLTGSICCAYLDHIVCYSSSVEQHIKDLEQIFERLCRAGLVLHPKKCHFLKAKCELLGFEVSGTGVRPSPERTKDIKNFSFPQDIEQLRRFLGEASFFRTHIRNFSDIAEPLLQCVRTLRRNPGMAEKEAFEKLKLALMDEYNLLAHDDLNITVDLLTYASNVGIGVVVMQTQNGQDKVISYASRCLSTTERKYSATERECLAVYFACSKFRTFLIPGKVRCIVDHHSLCWLFNKPNLNPRLTNSCLWLQHYQLQVIYKSGKLHTAPNCLSRIEINPATPIEEIGVNVIEHFDIKKLQQDDKFCSKQIMTLQTPVGNLNPKKVNEVRRYKLQKRILYREYLRDNTMRDLLVVPKICRMDVLYSCHDSKMAGHLDFNKTWQGIRNRFWWPGILNAVEKYTKSCVSCQTRNVPAQRPRRASQVIPISTFPFQRVHLDLAAPVPWSHDRYRYMAVYVDSYTKFSVVGALRTKEAKEVANWFIESVIL